MKRLFYLIPIIIVTLLFSCKDHNDHIETLFWDPVQVISGVVTNIDNQPLSNITICAIYSNGSDVSNISEDEIKSILDNGCPVMMGDVYTREDGKYDITAGATPNQTAAFVIATDTSNVYRSSLVATEIKYNENNSWGKGTADFILERRQ